MRNIVAVSVLVISILLIAGIVFWIALTLGDNPATAQPPTAAATPTLPPPRVNAGIPTSSSAALPTAVSLPPTAVPSTFTAAPPPTTLPTATPAPTAAPGPDWLQYLNLFRAEAGLPPVIENPNWSADSVLHSRYMVYTGQLGHIEEPNSEYFTAGGNEAAINGNIAATVSGMLPNRWAFNYWMSAAFHAVPMIDPELGSVGFGEYRDDAGIESVTATLDIKRGLGALPPSIRFPIMFPKEGGRTWVLRYSLPEFPFVLTTCPGFQQPSGPPVILQIGSGDQIPRVTGTAFMDSGKLLPHCAFDETNYFNPDSRLQRSGRSILDARDAIVILPQSPLELGKTYTVRVDVNGASHKWSFETVRDAPQ